MTGDPVHQWALDISTLSSWPSQSVDGLSLQKEMLERADAIDFLFRVSAHLHLYVILRPTVSCHPQFKLPGLFTDSCCLFASLLSSVSSVRNAEARKRVPYTSLRIWLSIVPGNCCRLHLSLHQG
jgi:hypothetical protein